MTVFLVIHGGLTGTPRAAYELPTAYLIYGPANIVVVGGLYVLLSNDEREVVSRFTRPSLTEIIRVAIAFVIGLGVYQITSRVGAALGTASEGSRSR